MSAKGDPRVTLAMTPLLCERMDACRAVAGLTRSGFITHAVKREVARVEARWAGHGCNDTSAKESANLFMRHRLIERMDACCAARGLTRRDFITFAFEREASQIEARLARRERERLARREARAESPAGNAVRSSGREATAG